jgi:hypothetical protein
MARIVVVGDVGGCLRQLTTALAPLVDDPDTVVVQVGDLVDRGPDSAGVLAYVADRLARAPQRWIQLLGNHEAQYLTGDLFWPEPLADGDAELLRGWWLRERLRVATALRTATGEEILLTHAALTAPAWHHLGAPVTAGTAADLLNTRPAELLAADFGPLWAEAGTEVYESWLQAAEPAPFSQAHGHSSIVDFTSRSWMCGGRIRSRSTVDWPARHTFTRIGAARFIGVDPRHGRTGAPQWAPLIFEDATLIA